MFSVFARKKSILNYEIREVVEFQLGIKTT